MTLAAFDVGVATARLERTAERPIVVEFLVGYAVLWLVLTAMSESDATADLAAAFAVAIATGATVLFLADAAENLGLAGRATLAAEGGD